MRRSTSCTCCRSRVELIDRTMIELAREIPIFRPTLDKFVRETPAAILLVEFGEPDHEENLRRLRRAQGD